MLTSTPDTTTAGEECGACHQLFPTLGDVFSHPCDAIARSTGYRPTTTEADSVDLPDWGTGPAAPKPPKANRFPGACARCGVTVPAAAGQLLRRDGGWVVEHLTGQCPEATAPTPAPAAVPAGDDHRPNRFPGSCTECGGHVAAGEGWLTGQRGAWTTQHATGTCPVAAPTPAAADGYDPTKGDVHVVDGQFYRVHIGQGSRRPYAVQWDGYGWELARGMIASLSTATLATAEDAARFGELYRCCVFCTRPLDTPESTTVGYGPVCAERRGLPWGVAA